MSDIIKIESTQNNENYCLIFSLDNKFYGINVENVLEIIKVPKLDVPQKMPKNILGLITYNNISVKIIDIYSILSYKKCNYSLDSQVIIIKTEEAIFGIIVDKAVDVRQLKSQNIQPLPYHSEDNLVQYIYRLDDIFVSIIDLNSVQNVIQKTQFETSTTDVTELFPQDQKSTSIMEKRQFDLIKKFESSIEQIYYDIEQYVIFTLSKNLYSLPIQNIREIVNLKNVSIVSLPSKYNYIEGIINLRGDFISVYNFEKFLKIDKGKKEKTSSGMLIVLELKDFKIALLVDEIIDITTIRPNEVIRKFDNKFESKYVVSEIHYNNKIISVISTDKLIADERLYIKD